MATPKNHYALWFAYAADLIQSGRRSFSRLEVADLLAATFECPVSWNWVDADGRFGFELREPIPGFPSHEEAEVWRAGMPAHPLLRWFAHSGDLSPTTVGRVPRDVAGEQGPRLLAEILAPRGLEQQLAIPYRMSMRHEAFVLARGGRDFTDFHVDLARRVQPLLVVLDRQTRVLDGMPAAAGETKLTGRELAVLELLCQGLTAAAIGRRLAVSHRTVHAHLRSIYRKLGVTDRMRAVLMAQEMGLLAPPTSAEERAGSGLVAQWSSATQARLPAALIR